MKKKDKDYLVMCEAALFCGKKPSTKEYNDALCPYVMPKNRSHTTVTNCSYLKGKYRLINTSLGIFNGNMEVKLYIHEETKLPKSLNELNKWRSNDNKYTRA